jgi:hypothetical protein
VGLFVLPQLGCPTAERDASALEREGMLGKSQRKVDLLIGEDHCNSGFVADRQHRGEQVSSSNRIFGPPTGPRAIASICCSPPLNRLPVVRRRSASKGNSAKTRSGGQPPGNAATARFSITVSDEKISRSCDTYPSPRRARQWVG